MENYILLTAALLGAGIIYGVYLTTTTVAEKFVEKQKWTARARHTEITLPIRLQAYERMCIFLDRTSPDNLLLRLAPLAENALELQRLLLHEIRNEYNHNAAQQMYISAQAWERISYAMNETVSDINQAAALVGPDAPAAELGKKIFSIVIEKETQSAKEALSVLKEEIKLLF